MTHEIETVRDLLAQSRVFTGIPHAVLDELAGCATLAVFPPGATMFRTGQPAGTFQVVRHGRVSIEMAAPGREPIIVATRTDGDAVGWSWLFEPYRWHFDAIALEQTRVISLDGECLRGKAATDHELGYHLMSRFADLAIRDLEHTELQLLDVYGHVASR